MFGHSHLQQQMIYLFLCLLIEAGCKTLMGMFDTFEDIIPLVLSLYIKSLAVESLSFMGNESMVLQKILLGLRQEFEFLESLNLLFFILNQVNFVGSILALRRELRAKKSHLIFYQ